LKISLKNSASIFELNNQNDLDKIDASLLNEIDPSIYSFLKEWFSISKEIKVSTSGSTGKPSIISTPKDSMRKSALLTLKYFKLQEGDFIVNCLPVNFIAGKMMLIRALIGNLHIYLLKPSDAPLCAYPNANIAFTALTPSQIEKSMHQCDRSFENIETIILGGAPISDNLRDQLKTLSPNCYATYGMTETITHIALQKINNGSEKDFSTLESVEINYHNNDCLSISAPHLKNAPILTNDIVKITSPTSFSWLGRSDFVINSGGIKIVPEILESKISKLITGAFFIHKIAHPIYTQIPVIVLEQEQIINWEEISKVLTKIELPKAMFHNESFAYTGSGKINRLISFKNSKEIKK